MTTFNLTRTYRQALDELRAATAWLAASNGALLLLRRADCRRFLARYRELLGRWTV